MIVIIKGSFGFLKKISVDKRKNTQMGHIWPVIAGKDPVVRNSKK